MADNDGITGKLCLKCGEIKPLTEFYFVKATQKPHTYCKKCCCQIAAAFSATHREQENATKQKYRDEHKEELREKRLAKPYPETYIDIDGKICKECGAWKSSDQFHRSGRMKDGLAHNCKECARELTRINYAENVEDRRASSAIYRAEHRQEARDRERERRRNDPEYLAKGLASLKKWKEANPELARQLANESGKRWRKRNPAKRAKIAKNWVANNRERDRANKKKYRAANRELYQEANKRWRLQNPEKKKALDAVNKHRRRSAEGILTAADLLAIRKSQNDRCVYCDRMLYGKGQMDHIIPVSPPHNGSNWPWNIQWLCARCNREKWATTHDEFVEKLKRNGDPRALKFFFLDAEIVSDE